MTSGLLNIGVTGLNAAQVALQTTSHNIANASTPGYNRQTVSQTSNSPIFIGTGYIGQGANVTNIQRIYSAYLGNQVLSAQTVASQLQTYSTQINQIDNLLADSSAGLTPSLQSYFSALSTAAANPSSLAARQSVISTAQSLSSRFQTLNDQMAQMRDGTNSQIRTEVDTINSLASQISDLNRRIGDAHNGDSQQMPNDLLDQRDKLVADLNKEVRVTTHLESNDSLSVFFGTGQPLVVGNGTYKLAVLPDREDVSNVRIGLSSAGTGVIDIPESLIDGGNLSGLLNYRTQTLDSAQNSLGRIALALTTDMNAQHALGQDLNGNIGGNLFKPISLGTVAAPSNTGTGALSANITASNYEVSFSGGAYNVTRQSDGTSLGPFATLPQMVDGVQIKLTSGAPANGDVFLVSPSAQSGQRVTALATNTGSAKLDSSPSNLQTLTDSDYRLEMTSANTFSLTRLSDNQVWSGTGASQSAALSAVLAAAGPQGFDASLSGAVQVGDSFLLRPTRDAAQYISTAISDPRLLALGTPFRTGAATSNTGTATISSGVVTDTSNLPTSQLSLVFHPATTVPVQPDRLQGFPVGSVVTVTPPGGQPSRYTISAATDFVPYTSGADIDFNGMKVAISGTPVDGDTFTLQPNPAGNSDSRNGVLLGNLQTSNTLLSGSASYMGAYAQLVSTVGNKAREVDARLSAQQTLVKQGEDAIQSKSGVNLDEEAANLLRYQQAYQASAKVLSIADKLFSQLINLGG